MSLNQLLAISIFPRFLPWDVRIPVRVIGAEGIVNMMQGVFVHGRCILPSYIGGERTSCAIIIVMDVAVMTASIVYQRLPFLVVGYMPSLGTNALDLTRGSSISHRCVPVVKQPASGHVGARHFIIAWCMVKLRDGRGNRSPVSIMGGAEVRLHPYLAAYSDCIITVPVVVLHRVANHFRFVLSIARTYNNSQ